MQNSRKNGRIHKLFGLVQSFSYIENFEVEMDGYTSDWQTQHTGIRQVCPLCPYLFLIVMTTLFHHVHTKKDNYSQTDRVAGAEFDEAT